MGKDATLQQRLTAIKPLLSQLIDPIKKDIKSDHLRQDRKFCAEYFPAKHIAKLTVAELKDGYQRALDSDPKADAIGDFLSQRWIVKRVDIYSYFEQELSKITSDFADLKEIDAATAKKIAAGAVAQFGPIDTYLFSILNAVVFPDAIFDDLREQALAAQKNESASAMQNEPAAEQNHLRQIEKYEKKLSDLERKYHHDIAVLKKQVATLQRKLQSNEE